MPTAKRWQTRLQLTGLSSFIKPWEDWYLQLHPSFSYLILKSSSWFHQSLPWATCRDRPLILQLFYPGITAEGIIGITRSVACCHTYVLRWDNGVYSPSTYYPDDCLYAMQLYGKHYIVLFPSFSLEFSINITAYTTVHFYKYPCSCAEVAMHPCMLIKRSFTWLCLMRHSGIEPEQFFIRISGVWCTFIDLLKICFTDF